MLPMITLGKLLSHVGLLISSFEGDFILHFERPCMDKRYYTFVKLMVYPLTNIVLANSK